MKRGYNKGKSGRERYVMLRHWLLDSPAWQSLTGNARSLYTDLARRYNGSNNGRIPYSVREGKESLHISPATVSRLLLTLQERGFIRCTKKGHFNLKAVKDASEWLLTEYDSDYPVAHAAKTFLLWQMPEDTDLKTLNSGPSHRKKRPQKSKTRLPPRNRTVTPVKPYGYPGETKSSKKRQNGYPHETVKAQNATPTVTLAKHLYLPGDVSAVVASVPSCAV